MPVYKEDEIALTLRAENGALSIGHLNGCPVEQGLDPGKALVGSGTEPSVSTNATKAFGEDMLKESTDPFDPCQTHVFGPASAAFGVLDRDVRAIIIDDGVLAHGGATDITREVVNDVLPRANGFGVDVPILSPNRSFDGVIEGRICLP